MTEPGHRDPAEPEILDEGGHDGEEARLPVGVYHNRRAVFVGGALLCALFGLIVFVAVLVATDPTTVSEWWVTIFAGSIGASPFLVLAGFVLGWLRGGPALEVSAEGLRIQRGGLWTFFPFVPVPEPEFLPWSDIVSIEAMPRTDQAVVIRMRGRPERWWEKLLPLEMPRGVRLGLSFIEGDPSRVAGDLVRWSEHRLELEVRKDSTGLRAGDAPAESLPGPEGEG